MGGNLCSDVATDPRRHHIALSLDHRTLGDRAIQEIVVAARTNICSIPEIPTAFDDYLTVLRILEKWLYMQRRFVSLVSWWDRAF